MQPREFVTKWVQVSSSEHKHYYTFCGYHMRTDTCARMRVDTIEWTLPREAWPDTDDVFFDVGGHGFELFPQPDLQQIIITHSSPVVCCGVVAGGGWWVVGGGW